LFVEVIVKDDTFYLLLQFVAPSALVVLKKVLEAEAHGEVEIELLRAFVQDLLTL
jgi:hypothetical protein